MAIRKTYLRIVMTLGLAVMGLDLSACDENEPNGPIEEPGGSAQHESTTCDEDFVYVTISVSAFYCADDATLKIFAADASGQRTDMQIGETTSLQDRETRSLLLPRGTTRLFVHIACGEVDLFDGPVAIPDCGSDAGVLDGGVVDGGVDDASLDATTADDATIDGGIADGATDASSMDASADASATDAGPALLGYAYLPTNPGSGVGDGQVLQYRVFSDGSLSAMTPSSVPAQERTGRAAAATVGASRFLYVSNTGSNSVSQFSIGADGRLTALSPATVSTGADTEPDTLLVSSSNLYVVNTTAHSVSQFSIGAGGALTSLGAAVSTGTGASGTSPTGICELGDRVYVANVGSMEGISVYSRSETGVLTRLSDVAPTSSGYTAIACAPDGTHLYVADVTEIRQFERSADTLVPLTPASVSADFGTTGLVSTADGSKLFAINIISQAVAFYDVSSAGLLSAMTPASVLLADSPSGAAFDSSGQYFYVTGAATSVTAYSVAALASPPQVTATGMSSQSITVIAP